MSLEDLKNRIKDHSLSNILGMYVDIVQKGAAKKARCPFHDDHDPSLMIDDNKGRWHCFVDNIGGDSIEFVMKLKHTDFKGALQDICEKLGWSFEEYEVKKKRSPKEDMARRILSRSEDLYRKMAGDKKTDTFPQFVQKRGLKPETVEEFKLGLSGRNGELFNYLQTIKDKKDRDFAISVAEEIGLLKPSQYEGASHYDKFRERIMFPIWDHYGQVIGFTSRAIRDDQMPKYMNSEDSFIFNKGQLLYGLHLARTYIRERNQVILVEGNMDVIALHQYGFKQSVAIMGIACSDASITRLLGLTQNIYLCLDNDGAGHKAMEKINHQFLEKGITPKYIDLNPHKDPDEFLKAMGTMEFKDRLDRAITCLDKLIDGLFPEKMPELTERKFEILEKAFALCAPLGNSLKAVERVVAFAKRLGLASDAKQIGQSYEEFISKQKRPTPTAKFAKAPEITEEIPPSDEFFDAFQMEALGQNYEEMGHASIPIPKADAELSASEKILLQQLVQHPELLTHSKTSELLDYVECNEVKRYVLRMKELYYEIDESEFPSLITDVLGSEDFPLNIKLIAGGALNNYTPQTLNEIVMNKIVNDLDQKLRLSMLTSKREKLKKVVATITTQEEADKLLMELKQVDVEIMQTKKRKPGSKGL